MIKNKQKNKLCLSALFLLAGTTSFVASAPDTPQQAIIIREVVHDSGSSTIGRIVRYTLIGGAIAGAIDYHYFNGRFVLQPLGRWLFPGFFARLDRMDERLENLETGITDVQTQVAANGERIDRVGTTANVLERIANEHTSTLNDHTGRLTALSEQATETQTTVKNNGTEIAAARKDVQGVRTVVDKHTGQLNDHAKQLNGVQEGIQATHKEVKGVKEVTDGHTQALAQLTQGQQATNASLDRIEEAMNARGNTPFATMLRTSAAQSPLVIRTLNGTQNNVHTFGNV